MKIQRLGRRAFKRFMEKQDPEFEGARAFSERLKGQESTIYPQGKPPSSYVLHEIYHATKSPDLVRIKAGEKYNDLDQTVAEELRADIFAAETRGRNYLWRLSTTQLELL